MNRNVMILLVIVPLLVSCEKDRVDYTKGYPFWNYEWQEGELMATYYSDGLETWQYKKYFNIADTVISPDGTKIHKWKVAKYRVDGGNFSGYFWDYSEVHVADKVIKFPDMRK